MPKRRFPAEQLVGDHKGQPRRAELCRLLVCAASEYFFYRPHELARFLRCSPPAVNYLKTSSRLKDQARPAQKRVLHELITKKF